MDGGGVSPPSAGGTCGGVGPVIRPPHADAESSAVKAATRTSLPMENDDCTTRRGAAPATVMQYRVREDDTIERASLARLSAPPCSRRRAAFGIGERRSIADACDTRSLSTDYRRRAQDPTAGTRDRARAPSRAQLYR